MLKVAVIFLYANLTFGQGYADLGRAIQDGPASSPATDPSSTTSTPAPKVCGSEDQTSLPQDEFMALMFKADAKLKVESKVGAIQVSPDSPMIGNCASMLEPRLRWNSSTSTHTYEIKFRTCGSASTCPFKVSTVEKDSNGADKVITDTKNYPPSYDGFYKCMEENLGIVTIDGKKSWDKSKRYPLEGFSVGNKTDQDGEILFISQGPHGAINSGESSLIENNSCDHYSKINGETHRHSSLDTVINEGVEQSANQLCRSNDYNLISQNMKEFESFGRIYEMLSAQRDKLLLSEVRRKRAEMAELANNNDLSEVDIKGFQQIMNDFNRIIMDKNISRKNHTEADKADPNLLTNIIADYKEAVINDDKELAASLKKEIAEKVNELSEFLEEPYFTADDYRSFTDMAKLPPMEKSAWRSSVDDLYKSLITLTLLCEAHGTNDTCKKHKDKGNFDSNKGTVTLKAVVNKANDWRRKMSDDYQDKVELIREPDSYRSLDYQQKIAVCQQQIAQMAQMAQMPMQSPQAGNCHELGHYQSQLARWTKYETDRDLYIGLSKEESLAKRQRAEMIVAQNLQRQQQRQFQPRMPQQQSPWIPSWQQTHNNYNFWGQNYNPNPYMNNMYGQPNPFGGAQLFNGGLNFNGGLYGGSLMSPYYGNPASYGAPNMMAPSYTFQ